MDRYLHVIYCDDIRFEMGNKKSFIGIYSGELWVPQCPVVLPKLCIFSSVVTSLEQPFEKLTIKVMTDDETLLEAPVTADQLHQSQSNIIENGANDNPHRRIAVTGTFVLSPFSIEKECILRVRAETEEGELTGNGIRIKVGQPPVAA